ncbi:MAG TPA: M20/M25/M40 family metallo-hydrolase [Pyrinomonadaceae bacterium]|nr:M20/M25/M40 family metallo-hydrolase [Pyrinomonadaceae bacterium]
MKKISTGFLLLVFIFVHTVFAQADKVDEQILARIRAEGFQNSQVMETLGYVTDVFGARLTNSPNLKNAQNWTRAKMISWGLENVQLEAWGNWGKGWSVDKFSVEMFEPTYDRLNAYPLAWTPSTGGAVSGKPVVVSIRSNADFEKYRGKLRGAIVLNGRFNLNSPESRFQTFSKRYTDEELARAAQATNPAKDGEINGGATTNYWDEEKDWQISLARGKEVTKFFKDEGVAALIQPSSRANGVLSAQGYYETDAGRNVPTFVVAREQYARIVRLTDRNVPVRLEMNLQTRVHEDLTGSNVVGEIAGSDPRLKDEVVLLGGHFDSWHSGTGATDNAAGCVVMMEALRILKAIGAKPRRTIRVALWSGEEQDYGGSLGYAQKHFGDPSTMRLKPAHEKLSAYYNLDNGTGRIRGIFLQGNEAVRPIFEEYLKPFHYLGAKTVSVLNTGGTDHMPFDALGLPGFQFIQDPIDYNTRTHHTNLDVLEAVLEEDLKINAVIIAAFAYQTAMRNEKLPRKPLPKPQPK